MNEQTITCPSCKTENHMRTVSAGTGTSCLRCYQISGGHNSERPHDWELLTVSKITALVETGVTSSGPGQITNEAMRPWQPFIRSFSVAV